MGHIVNITYQGGTHGSFLRFIIDKFSRSTPDLDGTPFTENGTVHKRLKYSNLINLYHPNEGPDYFVNTGEPHILITVDEDDLLFIERWATIRVADQRVDTSKDSIKLTDSFLEKFQWKDKFKSCFGIDVPEQPIPRFLMRDFYKLSFLDKSQSGFIVTDRLLKTHKPPNTFEFPVSSFWDKNKFLNTLKQLNNESLLDLDLSDMSVHDRFLKNITFMDTKDRVFDVIDAIKNNEQVDIQELDTVEQAYISAWIEKNYEFIQVPLINSFFKTTKEISEWLQHYPSHYKAMNPNLPTFNGIPNPYHLAKLKK